MPALVAMTCATIALFGGPRLVRTPEQIDAEKQAIIDQKVAFWSVLPSQIRTALKRESKARADAARTVEAVAN